MIRKKYKQERRIIMVLFSILNFVEDQYSKFSIILLIKKNHRYPTFLKKYQREPQEVYYYPC